MAAHPDPKLAAIQTKLVAKAPPPIHPPDAKALITQITTFSNAALQRKVTYAAQNNISLVLNAEEMALLLADINLSARGG